MNDEEKNLAEKELQSAPEILSVDDAMEVYEKTRILFRNFLFDEPQPSFAQVLKKFGKWLNHVSYLSKLTLHIVKYVQNWKRKH